MTCFNFAAVARERITIQSQTLADDTYGGNDASWATLTSCRAAVEPQSGKELFVNGQLQSRVVCKFLIRYNSALADTKTTGSYRILFQGRYFNINFIRNLDNDRKQYGRIYQEITAEENAAEVAT